MRLIIVFFLYASLSSFSQGAFIKTYNSNFFSVFGGSELKKTVTNGKLLVTWNVQTTPGDLPKIAVMDTAMQVLWCNQFKVLNFTNFTFKIENITFDQNNDLLVCGNADMNGDDCCLLMRINRITGNVYWNLVVNYVKGVTFYYSNQSLYFFGNRSTPNGIACYLSQFDNTGALGNWQVYSYVDNANGDYRITDAIKFNGNRHLVYFSPVVESRCDNRCKIMCLSDQMIPKWKTSYQELGFVPANNKSLIAVNDTQFVISSFERDSTLAKFDKKGQVLWAKKYNLGGAASPYTIAGNLLLMSRPEGAGSELIINESTGACVSLMNNLPCENLTGMYGNSLRYYDNNGQYQICSAGNYFSVANGCAGSGQLLPLTNFNVVALHHNFAYNGCAYQNAALPATSNFTLNFSDSTFTYPNSSYNTYFCNMLTSSVVPLSASYVEDGCGLSLGLQEKALSDFQIKVYPNPASDLVIVETATEGKLSLINSMGELVFASDTLKEGKNEIEISQLPEGIYLLQIECSGKLSAKKFLKQ